MNTVLVNVFTFEGSGGNPCPVVVDASEASSEQMRAVAGKYGYESGFVLRPASEDYDFTFRFFVPNHEMEMCGHATIGALWVLASRGLLTGEMVRIETRGGPVTGFVARTDGALEVEITQPVGKVTHLCKEQQADILSVLGIDRGALLDVPISNAVTSRVKTLIPLKDPERLNTLQVDLSRVEEVCRRIGSTGLYPYAVLDSRERRFEARQFPRSSGYPEDAATGIAAAALAFGMIEAGVIVPNDQTIRVFQGRTMGRLSEIRVRIGFAGSRVVGCLVGGAVSLE